ncbi:hypothetical protein CBR_g51281 [Chara braunii]|uniref:Uncharacterized protein n=1 Tax=Chara braunii TaxID=69332 RepID=A0A388M861_CHABU|nr:hypothetical protein CBR_g51281 [Chara braunii]|eukprot:GBG90774.1 hypothetical protein CBR_g51281 [Chara braunii]
MVSMNQIVKLDLFGTDGPGQGFKGRRDSGGCLFTSNSLSLPLFRLLDRGHHHRASFRDGGEEVVEEKREEAIIEGNREKEIRQSATTAAFADAPRPVRRPIRPIGMGMVDKAAVQESEFPNRAIISGGSNRRRLLQMVTVDSGNDNCENCGRRISFSYWLLIWGPGLVLCLLLFFRVPFWRLMKRGFHAIGIVWLGQRIAAAWVSLRGMFCGLSVARRTDEIDVEGNDVAGQAAAAEAAGGGGDGGLDSRRTVMAMHDQASSTSSVPIAVGRIGIEVAVAVGIGTDESQPGGASSSRGDYVHAEQPGEASVGAVGTSSPRSGNGNEQGGRGGRRGNRDPHGNARRSSRRSKRPLVVVLPPSPQDLPWLGVEKEERVPSGILAA